MESGDSNARRCSSEDNVFTITPCISVQNQAIEQLGSEYSDPKVLLAFLD